jgi:hypothetical protein
MQVIYNHYEVLSLGIAIGPIVFILGLFLRKRKGLSKTLIIFGLIYFIGSSLLIYQFVQGEKQIIKQREQVEKK